MPARTKSETMSTKAKTITKETKEETPKPKETKDTKKPEPKPKETKPKEPKETKPKETKKESEPKPKEPKETKKPEPKKETKPKESKETKTDSDEEKKKPKKVDRTRAKKKPQTKKTTVKETPTVIQLLEKAFDDLLYLKASGSGFLQITGAATYMSKTTSVVFNGKLRVAGTPEDIATFIAREEVAEFYSERDIDTSDESQVATHDNFATLKKDPKSWLSLEFETIKNSRTKEKTVMTGETYSELLDSFKPVTHRVVRSKDGSDKYDVMVTRLEDAKRMGKFIDVTGFNPESDGWTGAKQVDAPSKQTMIYTSVSDKYPICARGADKLRVYIKTVFADDESNRSALLEELDSKTSD